MNFEEIKGKYKVKKSFAIIALNIEKGSLEKVNIEKNDIWELVNGIIKNIMNSSSEKEIIYLEFKKGDLGFQLQYNDFLRLFGERL